MTAPARAGQRTEGLVLRPFDPATDYEPVAELVSATNAFDGLDWLMTQHEIRSEVRSGGAYDPGRDTRVAEVDGQPVGFIRISSRTRGGEKVVHRMETWTGPEWRRRGVGRALVNWAEERSRRLVEAGASWPQGLIHEMSGTLDEANAASAAFAEAMGYRLIRYSFEMRRRLDEPIPIAPLPAGLELRPVRAEDHRRIWDANAEAFRDHWEAAQRTDADFERDFADPDLDTSLWRVAWDGDEVAGVSMNTIFTEENERLGIKVGWLDQVSVRRPWRRRGVGAAVIAASLEALRERGLEEASLGVDAENPTGALALYERLGFRKYRSFRVYRKPL